MASYVREELAFTSADGKSRIAAFIYVPASGEIRAIVQLCHGMCEYIRRYEPMIEDLAAAGIAVAGNDHLGHGDTVSEMKGFFAAKGGYEFVLKDLEQMQRIIRERFPDVPYFLMGHSMGSFFARWLAVRDPEGMTGAVFSGSAGPGIMMNFGKLMASVLAKLEGPKKISKLMITASTGSYTSRIPDAPSPYAWLSRVPEVWAKYAADPNCTFPFTVSAYRDMLTAIVHVNTKAWAGAFPRDVPVWFLAGECDPVGNYGKGVKDAAELLRRAGVRHVDLTLYPGARHEMHNETNRDEYLSDLIGWIDARLKAAE